MTGASGPSPTLTPAAYLPVVATGTPGTPQPGARLQPSDLVYLGAFRLPDVDGEAEYSWVWSNWGSAMAYYPEGDPNGPADGFPGSLFGTGHDWNQWLSEISIPVPVVSPGKNLAELNTAATLQGFHDVRGGLFDWPMMEMPRAGLAYLPAQGEQSSGKLYFAWAPHLDEGATNPTHGWSELDLSNPQSSGLWRIGEYWNYVTGDYLLDIPPAWADAHAPGQFLGTGRARDGGQGAQGPSLLAVAPWAAGNPPAPGSTLPATPLLLYGSVYDGEGVHTMQGYHHSDEWSGAAWLTAGERSALLFAGTKGTGACWYGCSDGTVWPEQPPYPEGCPDDARGWWSTGFAGQIVFYDPADLAAVARGEREPWEPQPYATLDVGPYLYHIDHPQQKHHLGAISFDRVRGLLYVFEPLADGDKPLVHVWRVG